MQSSTSNDRLNVRLSGILLHPTSLPGRFGVGDFGDEAYRFVDFLVAAGQSYWQMLPLNPTGYGDSPYQTHSAFAGNPMLISIERLMQAGYLTEADISDMPHFPDDRVDFGAVNHHKRRLLKRAFANFRSSASDKARQSFLAFCEAQRDWLDGFALFMALKEAHDLEPWLAWEDELVYRRTEALSRWRDRLSEAIEEHQYIQWQFFEQWLALKRYANEQNVHIIGDIPIFVSMDSADVWANPQLFHFDEERQPTVVSGVPPDYFSENGQLWGHPLYRWDVMAQNDYAWWIDRFRMAFTQSDVARIDHFRGFYNYWEAPAGAETAVDGRWVRGPGAEFFRVVTDALGQVAIIAEDLGDFNEESRAGVDALQEEFGYPGMKVLQFAFAGDSDNSFLPHTYIPDCIAYTGAHDNDTVVGWYQTTSTEAERDYARRYLARDGSDIAWDLIRLAWSSVARTAITTVQDLLSLGHEARMNTPGDVGPPNWCWRFRSGALTEAVAARLRDMTQIYGRLP